jgi:hypothetical protein
VIEIGAHAVAYARAGHPVLPLHWPTSSGCSCTRADCPSEGKHPLTGRGKDDATTDAETVADWWARWPKANIGLRPAEGVVVLDVDADARSGGVSTMLAVLGDHPPLPPTATALTGGGGLHLWFSCPGPFRGELVRGVDLKASTGYVVAPPSLHASGRRYAWSVQEPIAPAPAWLVPQVQRHVVAPLAVPKAVGRFSALSGGGDAEDGLVRKVAEAEPGNRNKALHWAACRAVERGAAPDLLDRLRDAARSVGLDDREIEQTLRSARRTGAAS